MSLPFAYVHLKTPPEWIPQSQAPAVSFNCQNYLPRNDSALKSVWMLRPILDLIYFSEAY